MDILTPEQLAERLQVKPSWVYEQTRERNDVRKPDPLPFMKMGRYLRFDWNDVRDWLERQKRTSKPERYRATMASWVSLLGPDRLTNLGTRCTRSPVAPSLLGRNVLRGF